MPGSKQPVHDTETAIILKIHKTCDFQDVCREEFCCSRSPLERAPETPQIKSSWLALRRPDLRRYLVLHFRSLSIPPDGPASEVTPSSRASLLFRPLSTVIPVYPTCRH